MRKLILAVVATAAVVLSGTASAHFPPPPYSLTNDFGSPLHWYEKDNDLNTQVYNWVSDRTPAGLTHPRYTDRTWQSVIQQKVTELGYPMRLETRYERAGSAPCGDQEGWTVVCIIVDDTVTWAGRALVTSDWYGHIYSVYVQLNNTSRFINRPEHVACHEIGHGVGLDHYSDEDVSCMNDRTETQTDPWYDFYSWRNHGTIDEGLYTHNDAGYPDPAPNTRGCWNCESTGVEEEPDRGTPPADAPRLTEELARELGFDGLEDCRGLAVTVEEFEGILPTPFDPPQELVPPARSTKTYAC